MSSPMAASARSERISFWWRSRKRNSCARNRDTTCQQERTSCTMRAKEKVMNQENGKTKYYTLMEELKAAILSGRIRSEEHTSELQSRFDLVCRLLLEKK